MVLDRTEIDALAKECGLYIVEGRGTIGLAIEHPLLKDWKDHMYAVREDIVVKMIKDRLNELLTDYIKIKKEMKLKEILNARGKYDV